MAANRSTFLSRWQLLIGIALIAALAYALHFINRYPRTDDAYVQANTIAVASQVAGRIVALHTSENASVHKGDLLLAIDPRPYQLDLQRLQAQLATLDAQIMLARRQVDAQRHAADAAGLGIERARLNAAQRRSTLDRLAPLAQQEFISAEQLEQARTGASTAAAELRVAQADRQRALSTVGGVDALEAQRHELAAAIAHAAYQLEQTEIRAPFDGRVVDLRWSEGEYAAPGKPLFTLIDVRRWYVVANFRETEVTKLHAGAPARVYLMGAPERGFDGVIDSVGWGVLPEEGGSAQGLPKVPRSINWVHVEQRFPVRIRIDRPEADLLRVGASAVAVLVQEH